MSRSRLLVAAILLTGAVSLGCPKAPDAPTEAGSSFPTNAPTQPGVTIPSSSAEVAALMDAAVKGDPQRVGELIGAGARVNDKDDEGETALMKAADFGHHKVAYDLIFNGASLKEKSLQGETALLKAAGKGHADIVRLLLAPRAMLKASGVPDAELRDVAEPADPNQADRTGRSPLMRAMANGRLAAMQVLMRAEGVNKDLRDENGHTGLVLALAGGHFELAREFAEVFPNDLLNLVKPDERGTTLLIRAAGKGDVKTLRTLLAMNQVNWFRNAQQKGKSFLDHKDSDGKTALESAEAGNHTEAAALVKEFATVNTPDGWGRPQILNAAEKGDETLVRDLLARGADVTLTDGDGRTALILAAARGHADAVNALLGSLTAYGDSTTKLVPGVSSYEGPEPAEHANVKDNKGNTAPQLAKDGKHEATLEVMKAYGIR